ncbi:unnamed protein product [Rotaria sp. Silwood1]|nr:unnamed protein product [Rotaria sp. Silwood1]
MSADNEDSDKSTLQLLVNLLMKFMMKDDQNQVNEDRIMLKQQTNLGTVLLPFFLSFLQFSTCSNSSIQFYEHIAASKTLERIDPSLRDACINIQHLTRIAMNTILSHYHVCETPPFDVTGSGLSGRITPKVAGSRRGSPRPFHDISEIELKELGGRYDLEVKQNSGTSSTTGGVNSNTSTGIAPSLSSRVPTDKLIELDVKSITGIKELSRVLYSVERGKLETVLLKPDSSSGIKGFLIF